MTRRLHYFYIILFFCLPLVTRGQSSYNNLSSNSKKAIEFYSNGDQYYVRRDYYSAIEWFRKAVKKDDNFIEAWFRIGSSYYNLTDLPKAQQNWEKANDIAGSSRENAYIYYYLGKVYFELGAYDSSEAAMTQYLDLSAPNDRLRQEAETLLSSAEFATKSIEENLEFNPRPLDPAVNFFPLQYFPVMPVDQKSILFTRRMGTANYDDEDIYISFIGDDNQWQEPVSISENINSEFNEGTCSISADGRMLIFTSCYGRESLGSCDLYVSYKSGEEWSVPENMGKSINSGAWESQPSLSADGRTLYFISDRRSGGIGVRDIWRSTRNDDGTWTPANNLGEPINTELDEVSPFIHPNGTTLYFASKGHTGLGGFDIFFTELENGKWVNPTNMGYPMNTRDDQVSLFITADGSRGFYSNEYFDTTVMFRKSLIYEFDVPTSLRVTYKSTYIRGRVLDRSTSEPLLASVELMNLEKDSRVLAVNSDSVSGEYLMVLTEGAQYGLFVNSKGYLYKSLTFDLKAHEVGNPIEIDIYLEPIRKGASTTLNNIFFEINEFKLDSRSKPELDKAIRLMQANSEIRISIEGHTDDSGDAEYNLQLSEKRAKAVYNYLVENGISLKRIEFKGWGITKPLAPNNTDVNRARNRRIEFLIID